MTMMMMMMMIMLIMLAAAESGSERDVEQFGWTKVSDDQSSSV